MLNELAKQDEKKEPNLIREEVEDFGTSEVRFKIKEVREEAEFKNKLPPLPLDIWFQISSFLHHISREENCEAIVSLTVWEGKWIVIPWHQYPEGTLHVKFDQSSDENKKLMEEISGGKLEEFEEALNRVHCTIHSHNKAAASQSGDDQDDELTKNGWHITMGNFGTAKLSLHCRFNIKKDAKFNEQGEKIEKAFQKFLVTDSMLAVEEPQLIAGSHQIVKDHLESAIEDILQTKTRVSFPDQWVDNVKKQKTKYSHGSYGSYGSYGNRTGQHSTQSTNHQGNATTQQDIWDDDDYWEQSLLIEEAKETKIAEGGEAIMKPILSQLVTAQNEKKSIIFTAAELRILTGYAVATIEDIVEAGVKDSLKAKELSPAIVDACMIKTFKKYQWGTTIEFQIMRNNMPHKMHIYNILEARIAVAQKTNPTNPKIYDYQIQELIPRLIPQDKTVKASIEKLIKQSNEQHRNSSNK